MASRFVRPETRVLTISNNDTLVVRKRLTAGEKRVAYGRMYQAGVTGAQVNLTSIGLNMVLAYLLDWSLTDESGSQVVIRDLSLDELQSVLDNLSPEDFTEIKDAIEAHESEMEAERETAKKTQGGETGSAATSPSLSAVAGSSIGSES